ncbi:hypothetical protein BKM17_11925 [Pseudomonas syringae group genomosp. 3]|nr:hypothetical protein BKM17_11925 [Pseudomonas syringae group genomosp. 3]
MAADAARKLSAQPPNKVQFPDGSQKIVWVVWEGDAVAGIFPDWPSASACVGMLEEAQQKRILAKEQTRERDRLIQKTPGHNAE